MKKLIIAAIALSFMSAPAFAHGRRGDYWVGPAIVGAIIGGAILYNTLPPPQYHRPRTRCLEEQVYDQWGRPVFDAYGRPVTQIVCR